MTKPIARDVMYRGRVFEAEVIELCVRWYITYRLSYRDLVEIMAERGIQVSHTTILRWVQRYVSEYEKRLDVVVNVGGRQISIRAWARSPACVSGDALQVADDSWDERSERIAR